VQLVSKISNLYDPDSPTLQTDDMQSQYHTLRYSASRGKKAVFSETEMQYISSLPEYLYVLYGNVLSILNMISIILGC